MRRLFSRSVVVRRRGEAAVRIEAVGEVEGAVSVPAAQFALLEACRHPNGQWNDAPGGLVLSCRDCARPAIAFVAAHRLPQDHAAYTAASGDDEYPSLVALQETFASGATTAQLHTIEQLRVRDGVADLDPSLYVDEADPLVQAAPEATGPRRARRLRV